MNQEPTGRRGSYSAVATTLALFVIFSGCSNPVSLNEPLSPAEISAGTQVHHALAARTGLITNSKSTRYLAQFLERLKAGYPGEAQGAFAAVKITLLNSDGVLIASAANGEIFISAGAIQRVPHEAGFAFIVAHELGHLRHRDHLRFQLGQGDPAERYQAELAADHFALGLVALAGWNPDVAIETAAIIEAGHANVISPESAAYPNPAVRYQALQTELLESGWRTGARDAPGIVDRRDYFAFRKHLLASPRG